MITRISRRHRFLGTQLQLEHLILTRWFETVGRDRAGLSQRTWDPNLGSLINLFVPTPRGYGRRRRRRREGRKNAIDHAKESPNTHSLKFKVQTQGEKNSQPLRRFKPWPGDTITGQNGNKHRGGDLNNINIQSVVISSANQLTSCLWFTECYDVYREKDGSSGWSVPDKRGGFRFQLLA